jgi:DNA-binding GntR family transcriptional regulator
MGEPTRPGGPRPVTNQTRRDAVVHELRRSILAGELEAGQRVREVHVAQQMGISRPTLREAITQLTHEGFLEQTPYRGVVVASIDAKFITDVASVRVALETLAAKTVATDSDGSAKEVVEQAWQAYQEAHRTQNPERLPEAHLELHRSIWFASENNLLKRIWSTMEAQIGAAIGVDEDARADPDRALRLHERLIHAILGGDPDVIAAEVERHTGASADELLSMITERDLGSRADASA